MGTECLSARDIRWTSAAPRSSINPQTHSSGRAPHSTVREAAPAPGGSILRPRHSCDFARVPSRQDSPQTEQSTRANTMPRLDHVAVQRAPYTAGGSEVPCDRCAVAREADRGLTTPAASLDSFTRSTMGSLLGHDFRDVRVHVGPQAAASAAALGARAYTVGRDIVFGSGEYAPSTPRGRGLIAHELAHATQQARSVPSGEDIRLGSAVDVYERHAQCWSALASTSPSVYRASRGEERASDAKVIPSASRQTVQRQTLTERVLELVPGKHRQFARDLKESVTESPRFFVEFFDTELVAAVEQNWPKILAVTLGFVIAEEIIGALAAAPTGVSQVVAAILQILVLAILGYFAAVETKDAVDEGVRWVSLARDARGDPNRVADASRAFVRMIWHIVMAIIAIAGVRAKIRGIGATARGVVGAGAIEEGTAAGKGAATRGTNVTDIGTHPQYRPAFKPTPPGGAGPVARGSAFEGSAARALPAPAPIEPEPVRLPPPAAAPVATRPAVRPSVGRGTAAAAGAATATGTAVSRQGRRASAYPLCWPVQLGPAPATRFTRTTSPERDVDEQQQARLRLRYREQIDPGFVARDYHVHHVLPLMLGGADDLRSNAVTWPARVHLRGHAVLNRQPQMLRPRPGLPPLPANIIMHPPGTPYELAGYKENTDEVCTG